MKNNRSGEGVPAAALARANEFILYILLVSAFVLGGSSADASLRILLICLVASIALPVALLGGAWGAVSRLPRTLRIALILIPLVPIAQLIPLPAALWSLLPGREVPRDVFDLIGTSNAAHALSLSPTGTLFALVALLPAYAAFFSALLLNDRATERCIAVFVSLIFISVCVGGVQMGSGGASFNFYKFANRGDLIGFFANRNHQGLMLATGAIFSIAFVNKRVRSRQSALAWTVVLSLAFLAAVVGTVSRAALALMLLALVVSANLHFEISRKRRMLMFAGTAALIAFAFYLLSFSAVTTSALSRFDDMADNSRSEIWQNSWPLVTQYFPWGSGLGSFVPAYAALEPLDQVTSQYVNSPHNDYLAILIEAGVPGLLVLGIFSMAIAGQGIRLLRSPQSGGPFALTAGLGILLVALHSVVDYPLRTPAWITVFALLVAFFFSPPSETRKRVRVKSDHFHGEGHR